MIDEINPIRLPILLGILMAEPPPPLFILRDEKAQCDLKTKECKPSVTYFVTNGMDFFGYESVKYEPDLEAYEAILVEAIEEAALIFRSFQGEFSGVAAHDEPAERGE